MKILDDGGFIKKKGVVQIRGAVGGAGVVLGIFFVIGRGDRWRVHAQCALGHRTGE